jgi:LacI family transcriptional regulator
MRAHKVRRVALIYDGRSMYDLKVIMGVATYLQEQDYHSIYLEENALGGQRLLDPRTWEGDGIIADFDDPNIAKLVVESRLPAVSFGGGFGWRPESAPAPYIHANNKAIARLAADHLLECGFKNFAFVGYARTPTNGWSEEREDEFVQHVAGRGYLCAVFRGQHVFHGHHKSTRDWVPMQRMLGEWLSKLPRPLGVMAANDNRGRQVLEACRAYGLKVPDEIAVIGVDNDELLCRLSTPPLSSVEQGAWKLGYAAAALLDQIMDGRKPRQRNVVIDPTGIVTRRSTDVLAIDDLKVRQAMSFIREHACVGIKVNHVVAAVSISRSGLEKRFASVLGFTVRSAIRRSQLESVRRLILETEMPLKQVAAASGFKSVQHMTSVFTGAIGQTPAKYRRAESPAKRWDLAGDAHPAVDMRQISGLPTAQKRRNRIRRRWADVRK